MRRVETCTISLEGVELERILDLLLHSTESTLTIAVQVEITRPDGETDA